MRATTHGSGEVVALPLVLEAPVFPAILKHVISNTLELNLRTVFDGYAMDDLLSSPPAQEAAMCYTDTYGKGMRWWEEKEVGGKV